MVVKSYRDMLEEFRSHPEAKLSGPDGTPCGRETRGLLRRRSVTITGFTHIGKEARDLDRRREGTVHELADVQNDSGDGVSLVELVGLVLGRMPETERAAVAVAASVHRVPAG